MKKSNAKAIIKEKCKKYVPGYNEYVLFSQVKNNMICIIFIHSKEKPWKTKAFRVVKMRITYLENETKIKTR